MQQFAQVGGELLVVVPVLHVLLDVLEHLHHLDVGAAVLGAL